MLSHGIIGSLGKSQHRTNEGPWTASPGRAEHVVNNSALPWVTVTLNRPSFSIPQTLGMYKLLGCLTDRGGGFFTFIHLSPPKEKLPQFRWQMADFMAKRRAWTFEIFKLMEYLKMGLHSKLFSHVFLTSLVIVFYFLFTMIYGLPQIEILYDAKVPITSIYIYKYTSYWHLIYV